MSKPRFSNTDLKTDEQKHLEARQYWEWIRHIQNHGPSAKPLEYDGQVYYTKREFRNLFNLSEYELKCAIRRGELNGKPLRRITKKAYFDKRAD